MDTVGKISTFLMISLNAINFELINQIFIATISILTMIYWVIKIKKLLKKKANKESENEKD